MNDTLFYVVSGVEFVIFAAVLVYSLFETFRHKADSLEAAKTESADTEDLLREPFQVPMMEDNWDTEFDDPIPLPNGGELVKLRDAVEYIRQLPRGLLESERWQVAMKDLSRAVETPAWRFLARLAIMKALYGKTPPPIRTSARR
jgi:hypothetical protein